MTFKNLAVCQLIICAKEKEPSDLNNVTRKGFRKHFEFTDRLRYFVFGNLIDFIQDRSAITTYEVKKKGKRTTVRER